MLVGGRHGDLSKGQAMINMDVLMSMSMGRISMS